MNNHDWLTLHRVKFAKEIEGPSNPMKGPEQAEIWRFGPESPLGEDGFRTNVSDSWGGFALYSCREQAEEVFENLHRHLPFLDHAVETWHALVVPYAHRGGVDWRETVQYDSAIRVAPKDPKGPLVVMTTAGYDDPGPNDFDRIKKFNRGIDDVLAHYGGLPGNLRRALHSGAGTMTLWQDDQAMIAAAYKSGGHKTQMGNHNASPLFDYSSFTRGRVMLSKGTWGGENPMDAF